MLLWRIWCWGLWEASHTSSRIWVWSGSGGTSNTPIFSFVVHLCKILWWWCLFAFLTSFISQWYLVVGRLYILLGGPVDYIQNTLWHFVKTSLIFTEKHVRLPMYMPLGCTWTCVGMGVCVEIRGQCQVSFWVTLHLSFWDKIFL